MCIRDRRICVPKRCKCRRKDCRYRCLLDACQSGQYTVQICNHNLRLADLIHRSQKKKSILPDSAAIIIDAVSYTHLDVYKRQPQTLLSYRFGR